MPGMDTLGFGRYLNVKECPVAVSSAMGDRISPRVVFYFWKGIVEPDAAPCKVK